MRRLPVEYVNGYPIVPRWMRTPLAGYGLLVYEDKAEEKKTER